MIKHLLNKKNILIISIVFIVGIILMVITEVSVPTPRTLNKNPLSYSVTSNKPLNTVYVAFHINTSGDNFAPREFGLDLYVQNGNKGFKQTVDSCKEIGAPSPYSINENSVECDKKTYTFELLPEKIIFYRVQGDRKEVVTSIPISRLAKDVKLVNSYSLYSDSAEQNLSILQDTQ